ARSRKARGEAPVHEHEKTAGIDGEGAVLDVVAGESGGPVGRELKCALRDRQDARVAPLLLLGGRETEGREACEGVLAKGLQPDGIARAPGALEPLEAVAVVLPRIQECHFSVLHLPRSTRSPSPQAPVRAPSRQT